MARVNPIPHVKMPKEFAENRAMRAYFEQKDFIIFQMRERIGGGTDIIEETIQNEINNNAGLSILRAKTKNLEDRLSDLEDNDRSGTLDQKISTLNAKVNELIDELLAELVLHRPDRTNEQSVVVNQETIIKQLRLLSAMLDEGFSTGLTLDDIEED